MKATHKSNCAACRQRFWTIVSWRIWLEDAHAAFRAYGEPAPAVWATPQPGMRWTTFEMVVKRSSMARRDDVMPIWHIMLMLRMVRSEYADSDLANPPVRAIDDAESLDAALEWMDIGCVDTNTHTCHTAQEHR